MVGFDYKFLMVCRFKNALLVCVHGVYVCVIHDCRSQDVVLFSTLTWVLETELAVRTMCAGPQTALGDYFQH